MKRDTELDAQGTTNNHGSLQALDARSVEIVMFGGSDTNVSRAVEVRLLCNCRYATLLSYVGRGRTGNYFYILAHVSGPRPYVALTLGTIMTA